jgi:flavin reductase (DIM6/NTAB) family NADH-FMN oxidoreductase RutF
MMTPTASSADFVQAMGQHVASVCVITTFHGGERFGLTATAVTSICADPPRLLVCVNKSGQTHEKIVASKHFGVNVLAEEQEKIGQAFANILGRDFNRFSLGEWRAGEAGTPLLQNASAVFDCRVAETIDQFTHTIFIGEVLATAAGIGIDPLVYGARRFRGLRKIMTAPLPENTESLHF